MKGFIRVHLYVMATTKHPEYDPLRLINKMNVDRTLFPAQRNDFYVRIADIQHVSVFSTHEELGSFTNTAYKHQFPVYLITCINRFHNAHDPAWIEYIVHPNENERMERILAGTDNPMYDLVHELRYNPVIGIEKQQAKERFESKTFF